MGAMTKVMQRLREESGSPSDLPADAPPGQLPVADQMEGGAPSPSPVAEANIGGPSNADAGPQGDGAPLDPPEVGSTGADQRDSSAAAPGGDLSWQSAAEAPSNFVAAGSDANKTEPPPGGGEGQTPPPVAGGAASLSISSIDRATVAWVPERVDPVVIAFHDRYSAVAEQYRSVRARLLTINARQPALGGQVLAVTSAIPEEGKSASTLNLGLVMAEGGEHRILLADADFRRTSMARMLGIREAPGLADVLAGEASLQDAIQPTPFPNLKVLPAGKARNNAYGELLGGAALATVLAELRRCFDYAFLDTPPVTTVSDVCLVAPHCDGAIVVIEMRRTPEPVAQQAVRTLQANNVKVVGALLSRFEERGAGYYYYYYDRYYYYHNPNHNR